MGDRKSWGTGHLMDSGKRLLNLCAADELKVGSSLFCHKNTHKWNYGIDKIMISEAAQSLPRWLSGLRHSAHRLERSAGGAGFNPRIGR